MSQIFLLICILPFAAIPALFLLQVKSSVRNYYLLISIFVNQLSLVFFIGVNPQGIYEGGSIFVNLSIIYASALPLLVLLLTRPPKKMHPERAVLSFSSQFLKWSWAGIYLFAIYSSILAKTKLMPMATTFIFGIVLYLIIDGDFEFELLITAVYKFFGVIATLLNLSFIFRFDWSRYIVQTEDILNSDSRTYFSPIASILNLPVRLAGPFVSGQLGGIFSVFGIACYLNSREASKKKFYLITLAVFGSFSGSRTFYLTLTCLLIYHFTEKNLPQKALDFWIYLLFGSVFTGTLLYKFFLPLISQNSTTLENLTGRTKLWHLIIKNWSSKGFLGHGPNTLTQYSLEHLYFAFAHAHNSFLQYLWDFGIPGLIVVSTMIASLCLAVSKNQADRNQVVGLVLILLLIQTEPTILVGTQVCGWFWLVPLTYVYSRPHDSKIYHG